MALLLLRGALAIVFVVAAVGKLADLPGFRRTLADFRAPRPLIGALALLIPLAELAIAILLVPAATAQPAAWAAVALLAAFSAAAGLALARGERPDCGCFGTSPSAIGPATLGRNFLLAAAAAVIAVAGPGESLGGAEVSTEAAIGGAVLIALAALAWLNWQLFRQSGRLLQRVRALEQIELQRAHDERGGLPVTLVDGPGEGRRELERVGG